MHRLRHEVTTADELDRVYILRREQAADADGDRHGDDARHHHIVIPGHLEDHGDGRHGRAGAAADIAAIPTIAPVVTLTSSTGWMR